MNIINKFFGNKHEPVKFNLDNEPYFFKKLNKKSKLIDIRAQCKDKIFDKIIFCLPDGFEICEEDEKTITLESILQDGMVNLKRNSLLYEQLKKPEYDSSTSLSINNFRNINEEIPPKPNNNEQMAYINLYVNGKFYMECPINLSLGLVDFRKELFDMMQIDFLFVYPDGTPMTLEEEAPYIVEGILSNNNLYILTRERVNEQNLNNNNNNINNNNNNQLFPDINNLGNNLNPFSVLINEEEDNINYIKESRESKLQNLIKISKKVENIGNLNIYLYPKIKLTQEEQKNSINFMVVGQTGSGKTTLLNAFINYLLGVEFEDDFRFKLIYENTNISQAYAQTTKVTLYHIRPLIKDTPPIIVVDTPGFGDLGGVKHDKEICDLIRDKFCSELTYLNAICFVAQSTNARLTFNQKYIFNNIMDLFSEDVQENFIAMLTFCNVIDENPVVLEALKMKGSGFDLVLPAIKDTNWYFTFDNLAVFQSTKSKISNKSKVFYNFAMESYRDFTTKIKGLKRKNLESSKKVLEDRKILEQKLVVLEQIVKNTLSQMDSYRQTFEHVKALSDELVNKNFVYKVTEIKHRKEYDTSRCPNSSGGNYFTTCLIHYHTCHPGCYIPNNNNKKGCSAMDENGFCIKCRALGHGDCSWDNHENRDFYWEEYTEEVIKTDQDLKDKYVKKSSEKSKKEQILDGLLEDITNKNMQLIKTQDQMVETINEIQRIALNKKVFESAEQHIDLLIENEKYERKEGWQKRIEAYNDLKRQKNRLREIYKGVHEDANKIKAFVKSYNKEKLEKKLI